MLASLGGLVSCAAKVHFEVAGNAMNELIVNHDFDFRQLVTAAEGQPVTDTFQIAKAFGKRHADVLRALKNCHCSEDFRRAHFCVAEKINGLGIFDKKQIYYRMDFSGFVMLVMGFNGAKADAVKEAYINAFNWMSAELRKYSESYEAERNAIMLEYMKEKDVASMSGRLLNRWGKIKKPQLLARIERLEQHGQTVIPGLTN
ncbi:Rha family transcriptional regulator [Escherichia coli]|uniref:Rha family transcriptional regulator n=1 Tax=Escherichia coli TaxID=562 RepID=UPI0005CE644F|nr:Rha family transcriptional regulator [Escherichia coli]EEY7016324.1 Rha family transcriptional regulator [Escherichia coli]EFI2810197.1 Rha family transcriptional regulator [Escherichia coli]EIX1313856.1 Rha family transcriptional regulator [Escherichia coli]EJJ3125126.1 Rha family transcriptional regulator [Escherichia coli]ELW5544255.1 Rha family transcriptional regulator [Escherichia coli]